MFSTTLEKRRERYCREKHPEKAAATATAAEDEEDAIAGERCGPF